MYMYIYVYISQCSQTCAGFQYMGLQWENQCFCGNSYGTQGETDGCEDCGIGQRVCGGRNAVYRIGVCRPPPCPFHAHESMP